MSTHNENTAPPLEAGNVFAVFTTDHPGAPPFGDVSICPVPDLARDVLEAQLAAWAEREDIIVTAWGVRRDDSINHGASDVLFVEWCKLGKGAR